MTELLTDADVELLLSGGRPEAHEDLADLVVVLDEVRALGHGPAPEPSAELAAFLAAPTDAPVEAVPLPRPTRRPRWRVVAGGTAATVALGVGAGALGALPAAAQERFDRLVEQIAGRFDASVTGGDRSAPAVEPAEPRGPFSRRPEVGELPTLRAAAVPDSESRRGDDRPAAAADTAAGDQDRLRPSGARTAEPTAAPSGRPTGAGPSLDGRGEDDREDREDREDRDRDDRRPDNGGKGKGKDTGTGASKPGPSDDDPEDDEPEDDEPEDDEFEGDEPGDDEPGDDADRDGERPGQ